MHWKWRQDTKPPKLSFPTPQQPTPDLSAQVQTLVEKGVVYQVPRQRCYQSRIFLVPKKDGSKRLILDLSRLNEFIDCPHFKMTNHVTAAGLINPPAWATSIDLKDAYYHVPIRKNLHKFLAFQLGDELFFFRALPFGLSPAPLIFTKLLNAPLQTLRKEGVHVLGYIDDLLIWGASAQEALASTQRALDLLQSLGFLINWKKSALEPTQDTTWLGVRWLLQNGLWSLPTDSASSIVDSMLRLRDRGYASRRRWESLLAP